MGGAKRQLEEQWARGWSSSEKRICSFCINDYALKAVVEAEEIEGEGPCTTCGHAVSAPFDSLLGAFVDGIHFLYDDAVNSVPYVSSEGGFVGAETWDTWDLLEDFHDVFDDEASPEIIEELRARMESRDWVDRTDPDYGPAALLDAAWLEFCRVIKHETRYVFWLQREAVDEKADNRRPWEIEPATALRRVGDMIDELDLFKDYNLGHLFFRARTFAKNQDVPSSAKSLGTPPVGASLQGNRMSPAGIPMFYAGESADVVLDEVSVRTEHRSASVGKFRSTIPFRVVDLTAIPPLPSPFDRDRREQGWKIGFLRSFVERLSEPIETGRDQIDYVPTQVMSEYLLRIRWGREGVWGIRYPSAAHEGGISLVLDVSAEDCLEPGAEPDPGRLQMEFRSRDLFGARLTWTQAIQEPEDAAAVLVLERVALEDDSTVAADRSAGVPKPRKT